MSEIRETIETINSSWEEILKQDSEVLLKLLEEEREKFTKSDDKKKGLLVKALIEKGEYPAETQEGNPNSVMSMVDGWGAYWHRWSGPFECPHCNADFRDREAGPPFKREIGNMYNDRCAYFTCPDCNQRI